MLLHIGANLSAEVSPMARLFDPVCRMLEVAIRATVLRHNLIANNISNVDTPGYQAVDIRFEELLERVLRGEVEPEEVSFEPLARQPGVKLVLESGEGVRLDANTVDIDREMTKMVKNMILHNAFVKLLGRKYSTLKTAIRGTL